MTKHQPYPLVVTVALFALMLTTKANSQPAELDELRALIIKGAGHNVFSGSQTFSFGSNIFMHIDRDNDGITSAEIDLAEKVLDAETRANGVARLLKYDLNADFKVEKSEVSDYWSSLQRGRHNGTNSGTDEGLAQRMTDIVEGIFVLDDNKNGFIDGKELYALSPDTSEFPGSHVDQRFNIAGAKLLLKMDPNKDGTASHAEALMLFGQALDGVDIFLEINKNRQPIIEGGKF
jgi:hypothetical protein